MGDIKIENENLFLDALRTNINMFLGAGFSILAKNRADQSLPLGAAFATLLRNRFRTVPLPESLQLPQISTIIASRERDAFRQFAVDTFSVTEFDDRYLSLRDVAVANIFTTNVDNLVHKIADASPTWYIRDVFLNGPEPTSRHAVHFYALHGNVMHRDREMLFGASEIASAFGKDPQLWNHLANVMTTNPTLFWGYGMEDAGTLQAIHNQLSPSARKKERWIVLHPSAAQSEEYFRALGFWIIYSDSATLLEYIAAQKNTLPEGVDIRTPSEGLADYDVPSITSVPVRELEQFYMGGAPTWFDIYQNGPAETAHLTTCRNAVASNKNILIKGIPFSGKSTLLMMLAARFSPPGRQRLYSSYLEEGEARRIAQRLDGAPAVVFIDNFFDSVSAAKELHRHKNIQIIGADREHNFQSAFHVLDAQYLAIDVTDLTSRDIQIIREKIPASLRSSGRAVREEDSLFEVVERFTKTPNVSERIVQLFHELGANDDLTAELLVLFAYMHQARVPVSFDLLISYCGARGQQWDQVNEQLGIIGKLVREYAGLYADEEQDYFSSRSAVFAERSLMKAPPNIVKTVLEVLHRDISILKIPRYDVFQRHAFDNEIFARAFPNWKEGQALYNYVYEREVDGSRSPYIMQQCALYLSRKSIHKEAFKAIDEALRRSSGRVFSIRNTHSVVLFRANIAEYDDDSGEVLASLRRSMSILQECYRDDRRKYGHALTFARQAINFNERYGEVGFEYLETAELWLDEELKVTPRAREMSKLLRDVKARLGRKF